MVVVVEGLELFVQRFGGEVPGCFLLGWWRRLGLVVFGWILSVLIL